MPENTIVALLGLIASAVVCYGIPPDYCTSNARPESVSYACDPEDLSGIDSPWYKKSLTKRDYRDLRSVQPKEWSSTGNREYESEVQQSDVPESSDTYYYPPETCRATREIAGNSPYVIQRPIFGTEDTQKSVFIPSPNPVTMDANHYDSKINTQSSPSSPLAYETNQPKNLQSPATTFQTSPYISYPGSYYYSNPMMHSYDPYQTMASGAAFADDDDESDYTDEPSLPPQRFYVLYRADITSSGMDNEKIYPLSNEKMVTEEELGDVIKKAIKVAKQQRKQQNTLHEKRETEDEIQKKLRKVHEKRQHLNSGLSPSGIMLTPDIQHKPLNLPTEMNLKDKLEEATIKKSFSDSIAVGKKNKNSESEHDDTQENDEDIWGINRWETTRKQVEEKDTTFNENLKKENQNKAEDLKKQGTQREEKSEAIKETEVVQNDELDRIKKETHKHLEMEDMEKDSSEETKEEKESEENEGKPRQIMRIEKTKTKVEKSDAIIPVIKEPSTSTESLATKMI